MPTTASAKKRLRQNFKRRAHNRSVKSALKSHIRKVREAVKAGDIETAEQHFRMTARRLDHAAAHRVIHPNKAARLKSRLSKHIKQAKNG